MKGWRFLFLPDLVVPAELPPDETVLAQKTVSAMVDVMPWRPAPESFLPLSDPEQLKKLNHESQAGSTIMN